LLLPEHHEVANAVGAIAAAAVIGFVASDLTGWPIALTALAGGSAALLISGDRRRAVKGIDWGTIVFFASMFVVMGAVERSGLVAGLIEPFSSTLFASGWQSVASIFGLSAAVSQVTSNVPFVAFMLPVFRAAAADPGQWLALAAGSTLAGNLTLLGAAANVIVLEAAESRGETFSFTEFLKAGLPTGLVTMAIAGAFLAMVG
ncbi:MAG TPA: SLC13 family permease, partial [Candidatus Methanomethylicus sp.]|nr:SLC13 family permease [Candidatus Methanomethylicus sp.]